VYPARPAMTRAGKGRRKCYPPCKTFSYINTSYGDPLEKASKTSLPRDNFSDVPFLVRIEDMWWGPVYC
jgi:hypothetical protein